MQGSLFLGPDLGTQPGITCFAYCQDLYHTNFCLSCSLHFIFYKSSPHKDCEMSGTVKKLGTVIRLILFRPDITEMVDWAIKINHLGVKSQLSNLLQVMCFFKNRPVKRKSSMLGLPQKFSKSSGFYIRDIDVFVSRLLQ